MLAPPSLAQRGRELLLPRDLGRLVFRAPRLRSLPRGRGAPVVLIAGFGSGDNALLPLRVLLNRLGHDARPVRLGRITDDVEALAPQVAGISLRIAEQAGQPVALVGWSIGGVLAREAARDDPAAIRHVITLGTPVVGGPSYTALAPRYDPGRLAEIRARVDERNRTPIEVPITAVWSPNDGVVTPEACIDHHSPNVDHVAVRSSHVGLGFDPDVWSTVATTLVGTQGPRRSQPIVQ